MCLEQMAIPENIHRDFTVCTECVVSSNIYIHKLINTNMHATTIGVKGGHDFERQRDIIWKSSQRGKGREMYCNHVIMSSLQEFYFTFLLDIFIKYKVEKK